MLKEKGPVRFVSVPEFSSNHCFCSVRFGIFIFRFDAVSACTCSVPRPIPAGSRIKRSSVRFGWAGLVRFVDSFALFVEAHRVPHIL